MSKLSKGKKRRLWKQKWKQIQHIQVDEKYDGSPNHIHNEVHQYNETHQNDDILIHEYNDVYESNHANTNSYPVRDHFSYETEVHQYAYHNHNHKAKPIQLNNEPFTHFLNLSQLIKTASNENITNTLNSNKILNIFNNDSQLLIDVLLCGMNKLLFKVDIDIIDNFRNTLQSEMGIDDTDNEIDEPYISHHISKLIDLPNDIIKYSVISFLDFKSINKLENTSKTLFSICRDAPITAFDFYFNKFFIDNNGSYNILKYKNTKKLTIIFPDHSQESIYDPDEFHNKLPSSRKMNQILSQFRYFCNIEYLKIVHLDMEGPCDPYAKETLVISNLPTFNQLSNLKTFHIEGIKTPSKLLSKFVNINSKAHTNSITEIRLLDANIDSSLLTIAQKYLKKLRVLYLHRVYGSNENKVNIYSLLQRLKILVLSDVRGDLSHSLWSECGKNALIKLNNLEALHFHIDQSNNFALESLLNGVYCFSKLRKLCIDCKGKQYKLLITIINTCVNLKHLSLIIYESFLNQQEQTYGDRQAYPSQQQNDYDQKVDKKTDIKQMFKEFCDCIFKHKCVQQIRIVNKATKTMETSNKLAIALMDYFNSNVSMFYQKILSFQFISNIDLANNDAVNLKVFQLLSCLQNMNLIQDTLVLTFKPLEMYHIEKLQETFVSKPFCDFNMQISPYSGFKQRYSRYSTNKYVIHIGSWNDDTLHFFNCKYDCDV